VNAIRADHRIGTRGAKRDDEAHGKVIAFPSPTTRARRWCYRS